jgi:hypothetical protein
LRVTRLDLLFWTTGFLTNAALLFVLYHRGRARRVLFFTALIALNVMRTIVLYLVLHFGSKAAYFYSYWSFLLLDTILQLAVVYEIASSVFRPLNIWAQDLRRSFTQVALLSLAIAAGLTWLAEPVVRNGIRAFTSRGNLFSAVLLSELFVAMMALSIRSGIPWKAHVAKIAQGFGAYSVVTVMIEGAQTYLGAAPDQPAFIALSYVRMACYLGCAAYWTVSLWCDEQPIFIMTVEMHERLFTFQTQVDYYLRDLQSREK